MDRIDAIDHRVQVLKDWLEEAQNEYATLGRITESSSRVVIYRNAYLDGKMTTLRQAIGLLEGVK